MKGNKMFVQKVQNTNFTGFEFKNEFARKVFYDKLGKVSPQNAKNIKEYIAKTESEDNKVIINATESGEYQLFATFSNTYETVSERIFHSNSLKDFIKRSASKAAFKPMPNSNNLRT